MPFYRVCALRFALKVTVVALLFTAIPMIAKEPDVNAQPSSNAISIDSAEPAQAGGRPPASVCEPASLGSPFVPVDSWVYPAIFRLYGLGFVDHVFLGM